MDFFNFNEDMFNTIENHPLCIFTKLYAEDKSNKVYKECLENEIKLAIQTMVDNVDKETILTLKMFYDMCHINENNLDECCELDEETKVQITVTNRIVNEVYNKLCNVEKND